jgi:hypothetical protein
MKKSNLRNLIADRAVINDTVIAATGSSTEGIDNDLTTVSLFCGHSEPWEFFVSAAGYLHSLGREEALSVPEIMDAIDEDTDRAIAYLGEVVTLPVEQVLRAGREAARQAGENQKIKSVHVVLGLSFCRAKCGRDLKCLEECLTETSWAGKELQQWRDPILPQDSLV